jgi:hypothetical protein
MNPVRSLIAALLMCAALPLAAATRRHPVAPLANVTISGVVRDAVTGLPILGAIVHSGTSFCQQGGTKADGVYSLSIPGARPVLITVEQFAYETQTVAFTGAAGSTLDFALTPRPVATVKMVNGDTHIVTLDTALFGFAVPLSNYALGDNANLCKTDGSSFAPSKHDFAKIIGPPASVTYAPCCTFGPILTMNVEMKSGEKFLAYFHDSCYEGEIDFVGRERSTGTYVYLDFTTIAEIDFQ